MGDFCLPFFLRSRAIFKKENPVYTREEIAQKVGKTVRTVQRALDRLKEDGKIVRIGNKVSGYWEVLK